MNYLFILINEFMKSYATRATYDLLIAKVTALAKT